MKTRNTNDDIQGEGDYRAAQRFNTAERAFVSAGKVSRAARDAAPKSPKDEDEMRRAEAKGKSRAKGQGSLASDKRKTNK